MDTGLNSLVAIATFPALPAIPDLLSLELSTPGLAFSDTDTLRAAKAGVQEPFNTLVAKGTPDALMESVGLKSQQRPVQEKLAKAVEVFLENKDIGFVHEGIAELQSKLVKGGLSNTL